MTGWKGKMVLCFSDCFFFFFFFLTSSILLIYSLLNLFHFCFPSLFFMCHSYIVQMSPYFCLGSAFPLLFYLVPVNRSVVHGLVITPGSVCLLADCCRGLCWPDAGLLSQAAGFTGRGTVLCLPECAHCHPLQRTPSILYFPVRDLHPSVIPLSSVSQTEGF